MKQTKPIKPQMLTYAGLVKAAKKYYREGKLTAQHPDRTKRKCVYRVGASKYRCAIGAGLDAPHVRLALAYGGPVNDLVRNNVIAFATDEDHRQAALLQSAHDNWARAAHGWTKGPTVPVETDQPAEVINERRLSFAKLLGLKR